MEKEKKKPQVRDRRKKIDYKPKNPLKSNRFDYLKTHQDIENFIMKHLKDNKVLPTKAQISQALGINRKTVWSHMDDLRFQNMMPDYKALTPKVMLGLLSGCIRGSAMSVKLWMQIVEGYSDKVENEEVSADDESKKVTNVANYIFSLSDEEKERRLELLRQSQKPSKE